MKRVEQLIYQELGSACAAIIERLRHSQTSIEILCLGFREKSTNGGGVSPHENLIRVRRHAFILADKVTVAEWLGYLFVKQVPGVYIRFCDSLLGLGEGRFHRSLAGASGRWQR